MHILTRMKILMPVVLAALFHSVCGQEVSIVKGKLYDFEFSRISIQGDEDPFTGARDEFEAIILDSGAFSIQAEFYSPKTFLFLVDDKPVAQFFLCPGEDLTITADADGFWYNGVTSDYPAWSQVLREDYLNKYTIAFAENNIKDRTDIDRLVTFLFEINAQNISAADTFADRFALSACEKLFCSYEIGYAIFTYLWSDFLRQGYPIDHDAFRFMNRLRLDDTAAARHSLAYNRALEVYIFLNLRLAQKWYDAGSFDASSDAFNNLFYERILTTIPNEDVRNGLLTRKVISLLHAGSTAAEPLFKRYLNDCTNSAHREAAFKYYNEYRKNKQRSDGEIKIESLEGPLFEKLKVHRNKILYLDFWASWCAPCVQSIPFTAKLHEKYRDQGVEVVYISIDDNIGAAESAAKRLGLKGNVICLDRKQSEEVRRALKIQGIPHYTLVDANGVIVDADAPPPDSGTIETKLKELLEK